MIHMFSKRARSKQDEIDRIAELEAKVVAIGRSQAVIEFKLDGTIIAANQNFLAALGYEPEEVVGRHHSMFVEPALAGSAEYRMFWDRLKRGEFVAEKFLRLGKGGREVWIQASYNPLMDRDGRPFKVVKLATDVTATEIERLRLEDERADKAAHQERVVDSLASGLGALSDGNMTCRLNDAFPIEYEKLRIDFNASMNKLQQVMLAIDTNAQAIRSGTDEISTATDKIGRAHV